MGEEENTGNDQSHLAFLTRGKTMYEKKNLQPGAPHMKSS